MTNIIASLTFVAACALLLMPRLRRSEAWRATVTPLASIIGSGFLVSLPLLMGIAGSWAILPLAALIVLAYAIGGAVRFNIVHGEGLIDARKPLALFVLARAGHLTLGFAYFISVTYYLSLLAAFLLKGAGVDIPYGPKILTTVALATVGIYGFARGLRALEVFEEYGVALNLAVVAATLAALLYFGIRLEWTGSWPQAAAVPPFNWHSARVVLGLLIVVQGFETSRFLKGNYAPAMRVKTMRYAQLASGAIYITFYALAIPLAGHHFNRADVAAVTTLLGGVASFLPLMLIGGAVFAQTSASIADSIGGAGLIAEVSEEKLPRRYAYPLIAAGGIALTWSANVFEVITYASRAFALFYAVQCVIAMWVAAIAPEVDARAARMAWFGLLMVLAGAVAVLGIPGGG